MSSFVSFLVLHPMLERAVVSLRTGNVTGNVVSITLICEHRFV